MILDRGREREEGLKRAGEGSWVVKERKSGAGGPWPGRVIEEVRDEWERGSSPHLLPKLC